MNKKVLAVSNLQLRLVTAHLEYLVLTLKKAILSRCNCIIRVTAKLILSLLTGWVVSIPLSEIAAAERGFEGGIGGEWLAVLGVVWVTYRLAGRIL